MRKLALWSKLRDRGAGACNTRRRCLILLKGNPRRVPPSPPGGVILPVLLPVLFPVFLVGGRRRRAPRDARRGRRGAEDLRGCLPRGCGRGGGRGCGRRCGWSRGDGRSGVWFARPGAPPLL